MKRLALALALIAITLFGVAPSAQAQQGNCVLPGDILDVPTPGFLRNATPNLRTRVSGTLLPATLISHTTSRLRIRLPSIGLPYSVQFHVVHVEPNGSTKVVATARVCDDPNGGGSVTGPGGGAGSGRGAGLGQGFFLRTPNGQPVIRATRNEVAAPSGGPEYLLIGSSEEMARAQTMMSREGVSILRNTSLGALGARMSAVDLNGRMSLAELRSRLARQRISVIVDKHSVYGAAKGRTTYANRLLGLAPDTGCKLNRPVRVGVIDGPVDTSNPALRGVSVKSTSVLFPRDRTGSVDHATGIVALISGLGTDKLPQGISPGAEIFSVVAFARNGGRSVARLESIALGLNWMVENNVDIVNMSLAGPKNDSLEDIVKTVARKGLIMVAATGNGGTHSGRLSRIRSECHRRHRSRCARAVVQTRQWRTRGGLFRAWRGSAFTTWTGHDLCLGHVIRSGFCHCDHRARGRALGAAQAAATEHFAPTVPRPWASRKGQPVRLGTDPGR